MHKAKSVKSTLEATAHLSIMSVDVSHLGHSEKFPTNDHEFGDKFKFTV